MSGKGRTSQHAAAGIKRHGFEMPERRTRGETLLGQIIFPIYDTRYRKYKKDYLP